MEPEGISVTELRLGLPNTHYYLDWQPPVPPLNPAAHRGLLRRVREVCRRLDWKVLAAGSDAAAARLVFQTTTDNLESGLAALLQGTTRFRLHMVQPAAALLLIARRVHESGNGAPQFPGVRDASKSPDHPDVHFGMFMGELPWAERMLDLLTRCAHGNAPGPHSVTLAEVAESYPSSRDAIGPAYRSGRFSLKDIAEHFGMHFSEVSAIINAHSR